MTTLRLCLCALGVASSALASDPAPAAISHELFDRAIEFAENSDDRAHRLLVDDLEDGDAHALHLAASGLNATGTATDDAVSIWHALADGTNAHAPSAYALGLHYDDDGLGRDGNDGRGAALKYFVQAADGTGPERQAATYRAGKLLEQFRIVPRALDYYRRCARQTKRVEAEVTATCVEAHGALSDEIKTVPGGILGLIEVFKAGSLDGFPSKNSKEGKAWKRAVTNLKLYSSQLREGVEAQTLEKFRAAKGILTSAREDLEFLYKAGGMSDLQERMLDQILDIADTMGATHDKPATALERLDDSAREQVLDRLEEEAHKGNGDLLERLEEMQDELDDEL